MASVPVELNPPGPVANTEELVIIDDLDKLANAAIAMGWETTTHTGDDPSARYGAMVTARRLGKRPQSH